MLRILFIFGILGFSLYALYGFFSPLQTKSDALAFDSYLSGALQRNSQDTTRFNVSFHREEFRGSPTIIRNEGGERLHRPDNTSSSTSNKDTLSPYRNIRAIPNQETISQKGNFGTPDVSRPKIRSTITGGLIFDPALVLSDPVPASGGMYFGSDRG